MKKTILNVDGLYCIDCSGKLEKSISKLDGVKKVTINLGNGKLYLETQNLDINKRFIEKLNTLADEAERGATISSPSLKHEKKPSSETNHLHGGLSILSLVLSGIGIVLFILAIVFEKVLFRDTLVAYLPLYILAYLFLGYDVIWKAFRNIGRGEMFDEKFLMTIATIGAFALEEFLEAVAVMLFYKIGELFQDIAVARSRKSINSLMDLRPEIANLKKSDGSYEIVSPEDLKIGDIIQVRVGESVPIDGQIVSGKTSLDTKHLTGESKPVDVFQHSKVISGSINLMAVIEVEVTALFGDSAVSKIIEFIESNADRKSKQEKFITRFSKIYTPVVVLIGLLIAFALPGIIALINKTNYMDIMPMYLRGGLIFLVASCPCALVLSVPLSYFAGIGKSAKEGILVKSGSDLDDLRHITHVAFDKTGTITKGNFLVTKINKHINISDEEFLKISAYAEFRSNHLIARSIVETYGKSINDSLIDDVVEISGQGLSVMVDGKRVLIGNQKLLQSNNIDVETAADVGTHVYLAVNNQYYGNLIIADEIKETSYEAIRLLNKDNIKSTMVTGDQKEIADDIAKKLNITNSYAQCLPFEKVDIINNLKLTEKIAFVGDGINDAPVLVTADIGIAMGGVGSDVAIESADIVLMNDDLRKVAHSIEIAKRTHRTVIINVSIALVIKVIVLSMTLLSMFVPSFSSLNKYMMLAAVFADVGASLIATLYALTLLRTTKKDKQYNLSKESLQQY